VSGTTGATRTPNFTTLAGYTPQKYDWQLVFVFANFANANTCTFTPPTGQGWGLLTASADQSPDSTHHFAIFKKQWGAGYTDVTNPVFTVNTGTVWGAVGEVWRSPSGQWDPTAPIRDSAVTVVGSGATMTMTAPATAANAVAGDTRVHVYISCDNNTPNTKQASGDSYAINGTAVNVNTTANGYSLGVVYRDNVAAGAVATATLLQTANGADNWVAWTFLFVPGPAPPEVYSTSLESTYARINIENDAPAGSTITTGATATKWWRMPDPGVAPWSRARGDTVGIYLENASYNQYQCNFTIRWDQVDGSTVIGTIGLDLNGSENLMAQHDFASFTTDYVTAKGWIGCGHMVVVGATSATIYMWYQLGSSGTVQGPYSTTIDYSVVGFADLTFDHVGGFYDCSDDYSATDASNTYNLTIVAGASVPSNAVIQAMLAADATPYTGCWAHYRQRWIVGPIAASYTDDSGHSRNMNPGILTGAAGPEAPTFNSGATDTSINASAAGATSAVTAGQSIPASVSASAAGSTAAIVATQQMPTVVSTTAGAATAGVVATQLTPSSASALAAGATCTMAASQAAASVVVASAAAATATAGATQITPIAIAASAAGASCSVVASTEVNGATVNANANAATAAASATQVTSVAVAATVAGATASATAGQTHSAAVLASAGASTAAVVAGQQCTIEVVAVAGAATASATASQVIAATINASAAGATCAAVASPGLVGAVVTAFAAGATCAASATQITATTVNASAGAATCSAVARQSTGATVAASCAGATASISATQVTPAVINATCAGATCEAYASPGLSGAGINANAAGATCSVVATQVMSAAVDATAGAATATVTAGQSIAATVAATCAGATASATSTQVTPATITAACAGATCEAVAGHGGLIVSAFAAGATSDTSAGQEHTLSVSAACGLAACSVVADSGAPIVYPGHWALVPSTILVWQPRSGWSLFPGRSVTWVHPVGM
jgi:hypothetical protein